mmetsp:Transcript_100958/g.184154  ORF Transcript_100958/g.184154 Transcript_100958/m.184154 type:complete len:842 (-) Transcript_100958:161-2686(-)
MSPALVLLLLALQACSRSARARVPSTLPSGADDDCEAAQGAGIEQRDLSGTLQLLQTEIRLESRQHNASGLTAGRFDPRKGDAQDHISFLMVAANAANPVLDFIFGRSNQTDKVDFQKASSISLNQKGDLPAFLASLQFDIELVVVCVVIFALLLRWFPNMLAFRATGAWLEGEEKLEAQTAPFTWDAEEKSWTSWIWYSYAPTREQLIKTCGMDGAYLIAFTEMAQEILATIGIPLILVGCPIYFFAGGKAAGEDRLSQIGILNVEEDSWIFWPVSLTTWFVVIATQWRLHQWMHKFIDHRQEWLMSMPDPQRTTLLVEGIPDDICSDAALKDYFSRMYGASAVKAAYVVKKLDRLDGLVEEFTDVDAKLRRVLFEIKNNPDKPKPKFNLLYGDKDCEEYYYLELERLAADIMAEQERVVMEVQKAPEDTDIYATNGFITFEDRKTCEQAQAINKRLRIAQDELVVSYPPEPADVMWKDLEQAVAARYASDFFGYVSLVVLFLMFMPIVLAIAQATRLENLEEYRAFKRFTDAIGSYKVVLAGVMASAGLTFMLSFLPTFLMLIFTTFFTLKANRWAQLYCQTYYFWFLVVFVLLVTAVGNNIVHFIKLVGERPFLIFSILAEEMPVTSHFYLEYVPMQWVTHGMNMTRYINMMKYAVFKRIVEPEDAREMSEPEDQDYYGMGSRSARFAFLLVLGLVFSTICPLMVLLTWINFFLCRLFYGYLIPYAEETKKDLGGDHFALQILHVHLGLLIYITLMTGFMLQRATSNGPGIISAVCYLWWAIAFYWFRVKLQWHDLSYEQVVTRGDQFPVRKADGVYRQDALDPKILQKIRSNPYETM